MTKKADTVFGTVEIAPEAIEFIINIAASKVKGVHHVQGNMTSMSGEWFKRALSPKGVHLKVNEQGHFEADVFVSVYYGASVTKVAKTIQKQAKEQVLFMCDIAISQINVYITDLVTEIGEHFG
ncbi:MULTISPECIES: Asp23/Gls24 family envelope stress response protein [unclassified Granulicatella]|uniref:Asp23/Gls24 family envelope stress response protein n=1 Tax=unclassified Granulicatella TaxID=2630493 RepID=UPI001073834A|nr:MULTISPECIES: Asp23/Gls24 family envelope stress response protein [unclassified Granulicatella]MBF0779922.1 Asp23/Gls24 family envelope stress response protein [Granulicatella sp. 19428wC4_WM01]TFU96033.1 Asp23/Gls24 family envelope stress response protein [Granulicatella sp. WM01]